jgi:hypothetical protein
MVLNAYVQNIPISSYLVDLIFAYIINIPESDQSMDTWDLTTILWAYSYIDNYSENTEILFQFLLPQLLEQINDMTIYEMLLSLRAYVLTQHE